ncbi:ABC transporter substrate-binding protein [Magnetospirillum sp. 15-1]|uniref:ABC transporter substrate-binding protein n=1 Tax=Magnetospirillum sp. 15-1 TaxID=1979370 RepID=UPI001F5B1C3D|nr:ABC transporter substrate-binding protein [Magnetospirillum sp. 15-1]
MIKIAGILGIFAAAIFGAGGAWAEKPPIKIGAVLSTTGPAGYLGDPEKKALELFAERANADGGVIGRKIQIVLYDDGSDVGKAAVLAKRLIQTDDVDLIIGGTNTGTTMAIIPTVEAAGIPFISLAGAVAIIDPVKKWVFKTLHTDRMFAEAAMTDMAKRGLTKIALMTEDSGFGKSGRQQSLEVAKILGLEVVADETYGNRDPDMTAQMTNIRGNSAVQAILVFGVGQGPALVTKNYQQLGMTPPLYHTMGVASKDFIRLAGPATEGVRIPVTGLLIAEQLSDSDPQKPVLMSFKKAYEDSYKLEVTPFAGHSYDALQIALGAIKRANSTDREKVRDEIERTKGFAGTGGVFSMSPSDHMGLSLSAFRMVEIRNGEFRVSP